MNISAKPIDKNKLSYYHTLSVYLIISFFCISIFTLPALGSDSLKIDKKAQRKLKKQRKIDEGKFMITPLAGPAYTPELGFLIAFSALLSYKTNPKDSLICLLSAYTGVQSI